MRLSVIVSTFNQPEWLDLVLAGLSVQSCDGFELLIADDGSDGRTRHLLERISFGTSLRPRHVRHEDRGFRKCTILNQAVTQATGNYLIFLDGDCVPRADFVGQHASLAERGRFLSGGAVRLTMPLSRRITREDVLAGRAHDWQWLRSQGMPLSRDVLKLCASGAAQSSRLAPRDERLSGSLRSRIDGVSAALITRSVMATLFGRQDSSANRISVGRFLDALTSTRPTFNGGNASAWKDDLLRVNGFDERMGHGGLDRELGERLENAGVRGKQVRHRCVCVHLDHSRAYADAAVKELNERIRRQTRRSRTTWTPHGIVKAAARAA